MRSMEETVLLYRDVLRQALHELGVFSNPAVDDEWILNEISKKVLNRPITWRKCPHCDLMFPTTSLVFLHSLGSHPDRVKM
jgi:hypothetical protein